MVSIVCIVVARCNNLLNVFCKQAIALVFVHYDYKILILVLLQWCVYVIGNCILQATSYEARKQLKYHFSCCLALWD